MRPLKPEERQRIVENASAEESPSVIESEIEEYQELLSERFRTDPALPKSPEGALEAIGQEDRIRQLHEKLFHFEIEPEAPEEG